VLAGIPYTSFPEIPLGPFDLKTFGLCVAVGILLGGWLTARRNARIGIGIEQTERIVILLVVAGLIGARILFVVTSTDEWFALDGLDRWLYPIAVWNGGLQFSGGFIAALLLAPFITRRLPAAARWHLLDGAALGLAVGLAIGRIGCYAVGEHLGGPTSFFLGITYQGGDTVEGPLAVGQTYWSTPVLEFLYVAVILAVMLWVDRRGTAGAGTLAGIFSLMYGVLRFASDFVREYDSRWWGTIFDPQEVDASGASQVDRFGLTGAQFMCLALIVVGVWFLLSARKRESPAAYRERLAAEAEMGADASTDTTVGGTTAPAATADAASTDAASADAASADATTADETRAAAPDRIPDGPVVTVRDRDE